MMFYFLKVFDYDLFNRNQEMDLFGLILILGLILFILIISWFVRKGPIEFPDQDYDGLQNYSFNYNSKGDSMYSEPSKKISVVARLIIILIIIALVLIPIGQFIPAFR